MTTHLSDTQGKIKLPILIGIVVVALGGGFFAMKMMKPKSAEPMAPKEPELMAVTFPIGSFVVNLNPRDGFRYLKVTVALNVKGPMSEEELKKEAMMQKYVWSDIVVRHLSGRSYNEISSSEGRKDLEIALVEKLSEASKMHELEVDGIYFAEFVAQ